MLVSQPGDDLESGGSAQHRSPVQEATVPEPGTNIFYADRRIEAQRMKQFALY